MSKVYNTPLRPRSLSDSLRVLPVLYHRSRDPPVLELGVRPHFPKSHFVIVLEALGFDVVDRFFQNLKVILPL